MEYLKFLAVICTLFLVESKRVPPQILYERNIKISEITAETFSEEKAIPETMFGPPKNFSVGKYELLPYKHPRILFSKLDWEDFVNCYADERYRKGSWAKHYLDFTLDKGPDNEALSMISELDTSAYTGKTKANSYRLKKLADVMQNMTEYNEGGMFMYTLHSMINENLIAKNKKPYLSKLQNTTTAARIIVNYSKVVLAHYATYGCDRCKYVKGMKKSDLWNKKKLWFITNDWHTAGLGIALSYDVLYRKLSRIEKRFVRSALALMVHGRQHWGITDNSTRKSPNAMQHPHRIFSNWATYHANLHLVNLAIEGESDFDEMTKAQNVHYDRGIAVKISHLIDAFFKHSIYPDGSSFEDGYMYNLGMREGSLLLIALARRGQNYLDSPRFRNFIHMGAQMMEPYYCGHFLGHSSGGGHLYPTWQALARYVYPRGELTSMLWLQRMGLDFKNWKPCRLTWHQIMMQMAILGGEHSMVTNTLSPSGLSRAQRYGFPTSFYATRRGLLITRSSLAEDATYAHFDARPDAFFLGHDNADRGIFTLSALNRTWITDFSWHHHASQLHSLLHIDGQAQARKAPSVRMLKVKDFPLINIAAADLTYAYNVQWVRAFSYTKQPKLFEIVYNKGFPKRRLVSFNEKETAHPRTFGWPQDDPAADLGFREDTSLWGEFNIGFSGLFNWKRRYRNVLVKHYVRSFALVRLQGETNYVMIGDNVAMTDFKFHKFETYLILGRKIEIRNTSGCVGSKCEIVIDDQGRRKQLNVQISGLGHELRFRHETIKKHYTRLVVSSVTRRAEKFCMVIHPRLHGRVKLKLFRRGERCIVKTGRESRTFEFSHVDHSLVVEEEQSIPESTTEIDLGASEEPVSTPVVSKEAD